MPDFSEILSFLITVALGIPVISEIEDAFIPRIGSFDNIINLAHSMKFSSPRSFERDFWVTGLFLYLSFNLTILLANIVPATIKLSKSP